METSVTRDDDIARAIRQRDVGSLLRLMIADGLPVPRPGYLTETELWEYKADCPPPSARAAEHWADLAGDVLAFHNQRGGVIVFGITNEFHFVGVDVRVDSKLVNDQLRKYLGDVLWVEFHRAFIQSDQKYLGVLLIPPRGARIERFRTSSPSGGKRKFVEGGSAIREGDSTRIVSKKEADALARKLTAPIVGQTYAVDESFFRILAPQYVHFVERGGLVKTVRSALRDPRTSVTALTGIGGSGKTALATWAVLNAYDQKDFDFIVSTTAKDRELTMIGIEGLTPSISSFETLLDTILDVLQFPDLKTLEVSQRESEIRHLIEGSGGLLYVDNLETVDDPRIINFLDTLPVGVRAITTSRRTAVRVSVNPVDVGPLTDDETLKFVETMASVAGRGWISDLSPAERIRMGHACDSLPLAIQWTLARANSSSEAMAAADGLTGTPKHGEELLEFVFRRVFDSLKETERSVLQVLSLFQQPVPAEAVFAAVGLSSYQSLDAVESLLSDALIQRLFDPERNDYTYTLLPMTRVFVYDQVTKQEGLEAKVRKTLSDWFEAKDIKDQHERRVVRQIRQGTESPESALIDLALAAQRRGDLSGSQDLFEQALKRNSVSWKAARLYGELQRHELQNTAAALMLYEQAAANAPARGPERALIFREWGMLLRDSGDPQATDHAIEKFEIALGETPNDPIAIHALASMLSRKGMHRKVLTYLEPLAKHRSKSTRDKTLPLLESTYRALGETLKALETRREIDRLSDSP